MPPDGEAEARVAIFPLRRGILRFTGVTIARPDPLGLVPLVRQNLRAADGFDSAEALSAAAHRAAGRAALSGRRRGARGECRAQRGICGAARISARRPVAAHPLAELGEGRQTHREGIRGRIFCAPRAGAGHVRRRAAQRSLGRGRFRRRVVCLHGADAGIAAGFAVRRERNPTASPPGAASRTRIRCWKSSRR